MKRPYLYLVAVLIIVGMSSCSVSKNSTTPDDVYYSPASSAKVAAAANQGNSEYYSTPNENYVKMRVQNPDKWSYFDDYSTDYYGGYSPYGYSSGIGLSIGFGTGFYSPYYGGFGYYSPMSYYNSYYAWNNFYNPYYGGVVIVSGKNTTAPGYTTRMSSFNPSAYQGSYYNTRPGLHNTSNTSQYSQPYSGSNQNSNFNRSSNSRPSYSNPSPMRTSPSTFSTGGGGGGGGGGMRGGGGSRPGR